MTIFVPKWLFMVEHLSFYDQVYEVVRLVPAGRVTSYGAIAKFLGSGRSSRMVGWAMNESHGQVPEVPAHRVVNRIGVLTGKGHFDPPESMAERLLAEGIRVENDQIVDFESIFWDPAKELRL
jgi:methylated-DNA-protein-cysteine methyltransferase-like protein